VRGGWDLNKFQTRSSKSETGNGKIDPTLGNLSRSGIEILKAEYKLLHF
jgi:hypothetical protein